DVGILLAVAADPDIAFVVHVDAVVGLWPLIAFARSAPRAHETTILVVDQDRRGRAAAFGDRRVELGAALVVVQATGTAMDHPVAHASSLTLIIHQSRGLVTALESPLSLPPSGETNSARPGA